MTKCWAIAIGAVLLFGGASVASASCVGDAAAVRAECLGNTGPHDRARMADCNADYRDDVAECHRFGGESGPRPAPHVIHHPVMHHVPPPPPPPHHY